MAQQTPEDADRALVDQAASGSREAFDELVRRHQARIFNLARALAGNDGDAEDLAQEAFVRAFRGIRRFRGESSFRSWLYKVTVNAARSHLSRRIRQRPVWGQVIEADSPSSGAEAVGSGHDLEDELATRDAIDRALTALPEELRTAVVLRDIEGLEYREIADALKVPIGTVESRIFRGRQRLRALLGPIMRRSRAEVSAPVAAEPSQRGAATGSRTGNPQSGVEGGRP